MKMASAYSQLLHSELAIVAKRRTSPTSVQSQYIVGEVEGKDVLMVDDLTETAGTLSAAAKLVKEHGAQARLRRCFARAAQRTSRSSGCRTRSSTS